MNKPWQQLDTQNKTWVQDSLHADQPFSPAAQVLQGEYLAAGFNNAFIHNELPQRVHVAFFNEYYYMNIPPLQTQLQYSAAQENVFSENVREYSKLWYERWLPQIQAHHRAFNEYKLDSNNLIEFCTEFADFLIRAQDLWTIHGLNFIPMFIAPSQFLQICRKLCDDDNIALTALLSLNNETTAMGLALAELATGITSEGFASKLQLFLEQYGMRNDQYIEITNPTWKEDPAPVLELLKLYADISDINLLAKQQVLQQQKSQAYLYLKTKLKNNPVVSNAVFEQVYQAASLATKVQEDHNYYIEQRIIYQSRQFYLRFAELLQQQDLLQNTADVFFLRPAELLDHYQQQPVDLRNLIVERKQKQQHAATLTPPPMLGAMLTAAPAATSLNAALAEFFGQRFANVAQQNKFQGHGASAGKISGSVRVLTNAQQLNQLQRGEILVVKSTSPAWTPAFAIAAGLITEHGGILSHAAIVAREYQLPAIVGATLISEYLCTGDYVEIDGNSGQIILVKKHVI